MSLKHRMFFWDAINAIALWLTLAFSILWWEAFQGGARWPLPLLESTGGWLIYLFSRPDLSQGARMLYWMLLFPAAGMIWVGLLQLTAPYFGGHPAERPLTRFALASLPASLPGPYFAYLAGRMRGGWDIHTMVDVAMGQTLGIPQSRWLFPIYGVAAAAALAAHWYVYRRAYPLPGRIAWRHFGGCAILFGIIATGLGTLAGLPWR